MSQKVRKGLGGVVAGVGVTMLVGVLSGTGIARADIVNQDPIDPSTADSSAVVTMKERCMWYVSGVASSITLTKDAAEADEVYDGDQFSLSSALGDYIAWTSGNESGGVDDYDSHAYCTFFGEQTGIDVQGIWSSNEFTATAQTAPGVNSDDIAMDFTTDGTDPLTFGLTEGECRAAGTWGVGPSIVADASGEPNSILHLAATDATVRPADEPLANDKCNADVLVTASIPAGKTPRYAGKPYTFTGPTFTTEISIDSNR